jgi:hypothetical protein
MKKLIIIVPVIVLLGFIAFWIFVGFGSKSVTNDTSGSSVTLPSSGNVPVSTSINPVQEQSLITIAGSGGSVIPTLDFIHASTTGEYPNAGYYYLGYHSPLQGILDPTATDSPPYIIEYINATQFFNISLLQEPIGEVREKAQQYLMTQLGISQDQMCRLNYSLGVPARVNSQYAGRELGFSFCLGATKLPQ